MTAIVFNPYFPDWSVVRSITTGVLMVTAIVTLGWLVDRWGR